ncbi:MAG TPA: hypothetical protein VE871_00075 [Longimicrobium sp.]|nr:hypothetical protein [Longimicrobium sp.]
MHDHNTMVHLLSQLDLGTSVAETDQLLEVARVETSAFWDLLRDRADLIPGTKGSGKSALFRTFVDFLPVALLRERRVVVAHGIEDPGDPVFNAFRDDFERLSEAEFVAFWCIYLTSLAHEQFVKAPRYAELLKGAEEEIADFQTACINARIPEIKAKKSLRSILEWTLNVVKAWTPKLTLRFPEGQGELEFGFGSPSPSTPSTKPDTELLPEYIVKVRLTLEAVLKRVDLSLWLAIDRLDEIFPRRSPLERTALRGLLRAMRLLSSDQIRVKVFLRDDMLDEVVRGEEGFVALTHITARQADTLRWTEQQILTMLVKRIYANEPIREYLDVDIDRLESNLEYRTEAFYKVFPPTVHRPPNQATTLKWIYTHCADGRGVVTPRDVLEMLRRAIQHQQDSCHADPTGNSKAIIGSASLKYGLVELSNHKRVTFLQAEFPHLWGHIEKLVGGKSGFSEQALGRLFGTDAKRIAADLVSVGVLSATKRKGEVSYLVPFLYRPGLNVKRGNA